jgi:hypothetical protein
MNPISPRNLTAQFAHRAAGNPPSTLPHAAISNFFPGLEFDLRSLWKHIFVGIELHESGRVTQGHTVLAIAPGGAAASAGLRPGDRLVAVDTRPVEVQLVTGAGPTPNRAALEFFNSLADLAQRPGQQVRCAFQSATNGARIEVDLEVRSIFEGAALSQALLEPGAMTQGLCSPWQADYRECGCFYWAASRPDFVNVEVDQATGTARGQSWMQRDRSPGAPYVEDSPDGSGQITYDDLYTRWQEVLRFVIEGKDRE